MQDCNFGPVQVSAALIGQEVDEEIEDWEISNTA